MEVQQLKNKIFSLYMLCLDESLPDKQKYLLQLWNLIFNWKKKSDNDIRTEKIIFGTEVSLMGEEIYNVLRRFLGEARDYVPKNKEGFFRYLKTSLNRESARIKREEEFVKIPREKLEKNKKIDQQIELFISENNRKPTISEIKDIESEHFRAPKDYINLTSLIKIHELDSLTFDKDGNTETLSYLDQEEIPSAFNYDGVLNPKDELTKKYSPSGINKIKNFIENYLAENEKDKDCIRAIITINLCKDKEMDFDPLCPVLDTDILNEFILKEKKPNQYEIYQKYHNNVSKGSAESMASKMWKEFRDKLNEWNKTERIYINPKKP